MQAHINGSLVKRLLADCTGGLLAAIVALPLSLAFGVASEMGAAAGLYCAVACGIIAAALGGTPGMVSGPTGPVTVMVAAMASQHAGSPDLVCAAAIVAGAFQIILGKLKLGQLIQYMPHPVVSGFMTGIGVIIISIQLLPLAGLHAEGDIFSALLDFETSARGANLSALMLGLATIATIYLLRWMPIKIPPMLIALAGGTAASLVLNLDVPRIGAIPAGLPHLTIPVIELDRLHFVLACGLSLAIVASIDSLLTSVLVDKKTKQRHASNRELVAQGLGNICAGLIGGMPGSGTTMPSMVNVSSGGTSIVSGVFAGVLLLAVLLGLGKVASLIPLSVLAGILITVGISIMDKKTLRTIGKAPRTDTVVMLTVLVLTVFVDLIMAVAIGVALASTVFAKRMADSSRSMIKRMETLEEFRSLSEQLPVHVRQHFYLYDFIGPIFFGEVRNFIDAWNKMESAQIVILRFNNVPFIDQSGAYALEEALENWRGAPSGIIFVELSEGISSVLASVGIKLDQSNSFNTVEDAILHLIGRTWDAPQQPQMDASTA